MGRIPHRETPHITRKAFRLTCCPVKELKISHVGKSAGLVGTALRKHAVLIPSVVMLVVLGACAQPPGRHGGRLESPLQAGDIVYADSVNASEGGFIVKVDPVTGEQTIRSSGGELIQPFDVVLDVQGQIIASDSGHCCRLMRIAPATGEQTVVANS